MLELFFRKGELLSGFNSECMCMHIYTNACLRLGFPGGFPGGSDSKESACNEGDWDLIPGPGIFPWRREWPPTPIFMPGEFHGHRSLAGSSPWGHKESDTTERLNTAQNILKEKKEKTY